MLRPMLLLLLACAECPRFEEMEVTDPDGLDTDGRSAVVAAAIDYFARWTGREGVCVPEARIVSTEWADTWGIAGQYRGPHEPIYISTASQVPFHSTVHELCHALDEQEGIHAAHPELFPAESVEQSVNYLTDAQRGTEAFARACDEGPWDEGLARQVHAACGYGEITDTEWFVQREVYRHVAANVSRVPVSVERRALARGEGDVVALGTDGTGLLSLQVFYGALGLLWVTGPTLFLVDPTTGDLGRGVSLPLDTTDPAVRWSIVGGEGEAIVVASRAGSTAWRVDFAAGIATPLTGFPAATDGASLLGVVADGAAWVTEWTYPARPLRRYDLATGVTRTVPWPDGLDRLEGLGPAFRWAASGGRLVGLTSSGTLLVRDLAAGTWEVVAPPVEGLRGVAIDGDVIVVTADTYTSDPVEGVVTIPYLLLYDLETGEWALPEEPCGAALAANPYPITLADGAWIWEQEGPTLGRVVIDAP